MRTQSLQAKAEYYALNGSEIRELLHSENKRGTWRIAYCARTRLQLPRRMEEIVAKSFSFSLEGRTPCAIVEKATSVAMKKVLPSRAMRKQESSQEVNSQVTIA